MRDAAGNTNPFVDVAERHAVDYALRNTQQHLVQLSAQADLKASIVMTVSAVPTGVAAARASHDDMLWGIVAFITVLAGALAWAVMAIVPGRARPSGRQDPFFFVDAAAMSRGEYGTRMATLFGDDRTLYRVMVDNLYDHSVFLVRHKYRYLRHSYQWFMASFVAGTIGIVSQQLFG